jgi:hypothetical protein
LLCRNASEGTGKERLSLELGGLDELLVDTGMSRPSPPSGSREISALCRAEQARHLRPDVDLRLAAH